MADDNKDQKVVFSDEQQVKLQELINEAYSKGAAKQDKVLQQAAADLKAASDKVADLEGKVTELSKAKKDDGKDGKEGKDDADRRTKIGQLEAQIAEMRTNFETMQKDRDTLRTEVDNGKKAARNSQFGKSFDEVASEFNFFKPGTVRLELSEVLRHEEDGSITVLNPNTGQARLNGEMKPFTVKDLLAEYAKNNEHMVKTEVSGGSGSDESRKTDKKAGARKSISEMTPDEIKALEQRVAAGERIPLE